jgi:hypothetical protein
MSRADLLITTLYLRPLPQKMWDFPCQHCGKAQARWELHEPEEDEDGEEGMPRQEFNAVCSLCFLYESNWGRRRLDEIQEYIRDVEQEKGIKYLRDIGNRLLSCNDANNLLASLAMLSRVLEQRQASAALEQLQAMKEAEDSDGKEEDNEEAEGADEAVGDGG